MRLGPLRPGPPLARPARHATAEAIVMDGKVLRDEIIEALRKELEAAGSPPVCLATVLAGDDRPSEVYVRMKHQAAERAGMLSKHVGLPATSRRVRSRRRSPSWPPTPRCTASSSSCRCPTGSTPTPCSSRAGRQGRRRPHRAVDGPSRARRCRASSPCTPLGVMRLLAALRRRDEWSPGRDRRAVHARRPAAGPAAGPQGRRCNGDAGPLAHAGPRRGLPGGRHPRRRRRPGPHAHGRPRQARCRRRRRRCVAHGGRRRRRRRPSSRSPRSPGG